MTIESISVSNIVAQILILFLLILLGYVTAKTKYMPETTGRILSKFVIKVSMPATILIKMLGADFTADDYINGIVLYFSAVIFLLFALLLSVLLTKRMNMADTARNMYMIQSMFGNITFFAFPLYMVLFGEEGIVYALFFNMGSDTLLWSLGIYLANRHKETNFKSNLKHMINANTIAFVLGIVLMLTGLNKVLLNRSAFDSVYTTIDMIADTTSPLSMLFIGITLAGIKLTGIKDIKRKVPIFALSVQKLFVLPIISIAVFFLLRNLPFIRESAILIAVLQIAMPVGTTTASIAMEYDSDYEFATETVFVSTILSIVSLPFISFVLKFIF